MMGKQAAERMNVARTIRAPAAVGVEKHGQIGGDPAILTAGTSEVEQDRALPVLQCHAELANWGGRVLTDCSAVVELVGTMTTKGAPQGRVRVLRGRP